MAWAPPTLSKGVVLRDGECLGGLFTFTALGSCISVSFNSDIPPP